MDIRFTFHGAASTVTGSCFVVAHAKGRFMVDCGLFQGTKTIRELNYRDFPFEPSAIDYVLLTHAHIDHAGLLPKLVKHGFRGPIMATPPTSDLLGFVLPDSGHIQEIEVERLNRRNRQRGRPPVEPIYTESDAVRCNERLEDCDYGRWFEPGPGVRARFWNAAHILGSASIELEIQDGHGKPIRALFSGDIGPDETSFHPDPEGPRNLDVLVMESTYGDRDREDLTVELRRARLAKEINDAMATGGNLLIPAFAVERSQELLFTILDLIVRGAIPKCLVFLDSPLAIRATEVFTRHRDSLSESGELATLFRHPSLRFALTREDSEAINRIRGGAIILAASGMCEAGRIRHHLRHQLWRPETTVLFVGYQAPGTMGQLILSGEKRVRIMGEELAVRARIRQIDSFSAHADQRELLAWAKERGPVRHTTFLTHGEDYAIKALKAKLIEDGAEPNRVVSPQLDQSFVIERGAMAKATPGTPRIEPRFASSPADWHNAKARLMLDMAEELTQLPDDRARMDLINRLRRTLRS